MDPSKVQLDAKKTEASHIKAPHYWCSKHFPLAHFLNQKHPAINHRNPACKTAIDSLKKLAES
jgi:hypothetical protein